MRAFAAAFVLAALVGVIITPLIRRLAIRIGAVDRPGGRHVHQHTTARLGGVAIFLAFLTPLVGLFYAESVVAAAFRSDATLVLGLIVGGFCMCALGVVDDTRGMRALHKLFIQIGVAVIAFACGFRIEAVTLPLFGSLSMGIFALPVTLFWIVGIVNAVNLIDGLDGLAAGVVFFAALTNFVVAYVSGSVFVAVLMAAIIGSVVGFLVFNFNPARIFMGDSGSYFLGYVLATASLAGASQKASTTVALLVPIIALGVPIFDTLFAMVRRFLERRPIFSADRGHIHHRLLDMGITHRRAVLILYGVSVLFTVAAIAVSLGRNWHAGLAILGASVVAIGLVRFVGYFEYLHLRRRQKARIRSRHTESLRHMLPSVPSLIGQATDHVGILKALETLTQEGRLGYVELIAVAGNQETSLFRWENPQESGEREIMVSARYPIGGDMLGTVDIKFGWTSDLNEVSPQVDILLQIIADVIHGQLLHIGQPLAPPELRAAISAVPPSDSSAMVVLDAEPKDT